MPREFKEGYLYSLTGLPYESINESGSEVCNIFTEHTLLCFGGNDNEKSYFLCDVDDAAEIDVAEGSHVNPECMDVGEWLNDGTAKFVVCESDDRKADASYVTVALLF